jgi:protein ImuB
MKRRFTVIWFKSLMPDWLQRKRPALKGTAFALALTEKGRRVVKAVSAEARSRGVYSEMVVADCKALVPELEVLDFDAGQSQKLLDSLAEWCIRYTPVVSVDLPDGLILENSGCTHLWGGEKEYVNDLRNRLENFGYGVNVAMADTIGSAWAVSRFGSGMSIIPPGEQMKLLNMLPPAALRLEALAIERFGKLGLKTIGHFMQMPRTALRRRFGQNLLTRLDQASGQEIEFINPVRPIPSYHERLHSMEPILTATGIEIALKTLLENLFERMERENKGVRQCEFICYRIDGAFQKISVGTSRPSRNVRHLFRLFEIKIPEIEPDLGIELFILAAGVVEELPATQDALWSTGTANTSAIAELLDRLAGKTGGQSIQRFLPAEHYWPERSLKNAASLIEKPTTKWRIDQPRPLHLLHQPEPIEVTAPIPDYPPMLFRYQGIIHTVKKSDGPERIEQEWWIESGLYRDYYCVEDENGGRYWLFRSGDYKDQRPKWFIHGFFA